MSTYQDLVAACEADVRASQTQNVAKRLAKLNTARVPREMRLPLANICRRAGLHSLGITLLTRVVHPQKINPQDAATQPELAEYGVLLLRSGALSEALSTLDEVDAKTVPESLLYRAFCHFSAWEFRQAIPHLKDYLATPLAPYAALVAKVNLAYALVECEMYPEAAALLNEAISYAHANGHARLEGNCHSLLAQLNIKRSDFEGALKRLGTAQNILGSSRTEDYQYITKWRLIVEALQSQSLEPIDRLRSLAIDAQDWEGAREADLFSLKIKFERARYLRLIFGTPFDQYRQRVLRETGQPNDRSIYVYGDKQAPRLDLRTAEIDGYPALNPGRKSHQLLDVLLRDFYRPQRVPAIFSNLFPGEHFDIFSSPDRIYQAIRRTRRWFESDKIPLEIREKGGFYSLHIVGDFSFRVPLERESVECMNLHFNNLMAAFGQIQAFSAKEARERLKLSRRTIQRLVNWGIETGRIDKFGPTKAAIKYRINSTAPTKAA
jgi:tetratricopeptide (TPR) repeat protein